MDSVDNFVDNVDNFRQLSTAKEKKSSIPGFFSRFSVDNSAGSMENMKKPPKSIFLEEYARQKKQTVFYHGSYLSRFNTYVYLYIFRETRCGYSCG
ncbi:MAG: hypothetical protein IKH57_18035 [Clostridia bacterium]|nr:hypothetical protein [Clostridia bacterium]